jgi:hypothetical protein
MESKVEKEHVKIQNAEATQLAYDFLVDPANMRLHVKRYSHSVIDTLGRTSDFLHMLKTFDDVFLINNSIRYPHSQYLQERDDMSLQHNGGVWASTSSGQCTAR